MFSTIIVRNKWFWHLWYSNYSDFYSHGELYTYSLNSIHFPLNKLLSIIRKILLTSSRQPCKCRSDCRVFSLTLRINLHDGFICEKRVLAPFMMFRFQKEIALRIQMTSAWTGQFVHIIATSEIFRIFHKANFSINNLVTSRE